jgi:hypothetical protein
VPSVPGAPDNPQWIIADTDACLQLSVIDKINILHVLGADYGIQTVITEAVKIEIENKFLGKFRGYDGPFKKAIQKGVISVLDHEWIRNAFGADDDGRFDEMNQLGEDLYAMVHRGEAYTHAAAIILDVPCLTNDRSAVNTLRRAGVRLTPHIFRSFDVLLLGLQAGLVEMSDCEASRKLLAKLDERVPESFRGYSFEAGLTKFFPRLLDAGKASCGSVTSDDRLDIRLWIRRTRSDAVSGEGI